MPLQHEIYWRGTEPVTPTPPLEGDHDCDVCVIGGGYTGLWTAHFLKQAEPSLRVSIVEADYAGAGASGHNDGFATPTIGHGLANVVRRFGNERAKLGYAAVGRSLVELGRFCRKQSISAELEGSTVHFVATNPEQLRRLERDMTLAQQLGARSALLDAAQAQSVIGCEAIQGAIKQAGMLINPHKLARGLAGVVRAAGVSIFEQTPAREFHWRGTRQMVNTPRGRVLADQVVLATNAYQHQFAPFHRQVKPVWSYAMVSEPLPPEWIDQLPWQDRTGFVEVRNFIVFARLTAENRLLIGGGPAVYFYGRDMNMRHIGEQHAWGELRAALARFFPRWREVRFTHAYGGCVAITRDLIPHVGTFARGIHYAYGYCGNGITATHTAGKVLRDLVLGRETDYTALLFVKGRDPRFPPEPIAWLGAKSLSGLLAIQDRHPSRFKRDLL